MAKITKATVKSFIKKNIDDMYINVRSGFDGMTDGLESRNQGFVKAEVDEDHSKNTLGIKGAWFVNGGRDYFTAYEKDGLKGIEVANSCGYFTLAIR